MFVKHTVCYLDQGKNEEFRQVVAKVLLIEKKTTTCLFTPLSQVETLLGVNGHLYMIPHI